MKTIQVKINKSFPPHQAGQIVRVPVNDFGTPIGKLWRDRLRDAETDQCVEIVKEKKTKTQTKPKQSPSEDS